LYVPVIKSICERWSIRLVWTLPSYAEDEYVLKNVLSRLEFCETFWPSLMHTIDEFGIRCLEVDLHTLAAVLMNSADPESIIVALHQKNCTLWISVDNAVEFLDYGKMCTLMNTVRPIFERMVLKSFGFMEINKLPTSKGTYRTMTLGADNSLTSFDALFTYVLQWCGNEQILMELATCGIEYTVDKNDSEIVDKYRFVPLSVIKHRLRFGGLRHHQYYDHVNNVCMAHFPDENSWICFDSEQVRIEKLRYAKNEKLGGIVVGELHNDVAPNSEECVLKVASRFMA
jgi:hypothetical protein